MYPMNQLEYLFRNRKINNMIYTWSGHPPKSKQECVLEAARLRKSPGFTNTLFKVVDLETGLYTTYMRPKGRSWEEPY